MTSKPEVFRRGKLKDWMPWREFVLTPLRPKS